MLPRIKLSELLLEVSHWSQFDKYFTHALSNHDVNDKEKATLMGMGTNIGQNGKTCTRYCTMY